MGRRVYRNSIDCGAVLLEAAIALPILLLFTAGAIGFTLEINKYSAMVAATREAAREAARHGALVLTQAEVDALVGAGQFTLVRDLVVTRATNAAVDFLAAAGYPWSRTTAPSTPNFRISVKSLPINFPAQNLSMSAIEVTICNDTRSPLTFGPFEFAVQVSGSFLVESRISLPAFAEPLALPPC